MRYSIFILIFVVLGMGFIDLSMVSWCFYLGVILYSYFFFFQVDMARKWLHTCNVEDEPHDTYNTFESQGTSLNNESHGRSQLSQPQDPLQNISQPQGSQDHSQWNDDSDIESTVVAMQITGIIYIITYICILIRLM